MVIMRHIVLVGHSAEDLNRQIHEKEDEGWVALPDTFRMEVGERYHRYAVVMAEDDSSNHALDPESMG